MHIASLHERPEAQALPHVPQFCESLVGLIQWPLHLMNGLLHAQEANKNESVKVSGNNLRARRCIGLLLMVSTAALCEIMKRLTPIRTSACQPDDTVASRGRGGLLRLGNPRRRYRQRTAREPRPGQVPYHRQELHHRPNSTRSAAVGHDRMEFSVGTGIGSVP